MQKYLKDFNLYENYKKWHRGCGIFECFVHSTSFATLKNYPDFELHQVSLNRDHFTNDILQFVSSYVHPNTLFMLDYNSKSTLKAAGVLQTKLLLKPVLTFRHINHPYGLVFDNESISSLILYGERMTDVNQNGFVFLLDYDRYSDYDDEVYKSKFNNQYEITEYDLPVCEMLKDLGYEKVVFLSQDDIKEDIEPYLEYLQQNDIQVIKACI